MQAESQVRRTMSKRLTAKYTVDDFVHQNWQTKRVIEQAKRFALTDSTVLISGGTGTGKEILAHAIHNLSRRRRGPFVSINCAALPEQLLESELFGYEEGAFTGSKRGGKPGLFELAHNGSIFLDEIGGTPLSLQTRLLRVLQEREVMRIGGDRLIPVNLRVISAANQDLSREVAQGRFREDLFFRLNVLKLAIPPLKERTDDLPMLLRALIKRAARRHRMPPVDIPGPCLDQLCCLPWPGNVRQLSNFAERLIVLCGGEFQQAVFDELCTELVEYSLCQKPEPKQPGGQPLPQYLAAKQRGEEARMIQRALEETAFNKARAAKRLGISRTTLWRKMKSLGMI
jgi:propionate catabolism operon transcriptional regulator